LSQQTIAFFNYHVFTISSQQFLTFIIIQL